MAKFIVYGLFDPRDGQLRYVGKTERGLQKRLYGHISAAHKSKYYSAKWIVSLLESGFRPEIDVLEYSTDSNSLNEAEIFWIGYAKFLGCRLTNLTKGGEGTVGWNPNREWRDKRAQYAREAQAAGIISVKSIHTKESQAKAALSRTGKKYGPHSQERILNNSRSQGGRAIVDNNGIRYETIAEAARVLKLNKRAISAVLKGKRFKHHGMTFRYVDD